MFYYTVYINASQSWCQIKTVSLDFGGLLNNLSIHRGLTHSPRPGISPIYFIKMFSYILGHKSSLSKFKKMEIISSIFSDHNVVRLDVNHRKKLLKIQTYGG